MNRKEQMVDELASLTAKFFNDAIKIADDYEEDRKEFLKRVAVTIVQSVAIGNFDNFKTEGGNLN